MRKKFIALLCTILFVFVFSTMCFAAGSPTATVIPTETQVKRYNLVITDIQPSQDTISVGDRLIFDVTIKNIGDADLPAGTVVEYHLEFSDGSSVVLWNDTYDKGLKPGESVTLRTSSGSNGVNYWKAPKGKVTITGTVDPNNKFPDESNKKDNTYSIKLNIPKNGKETTKPPTTTKAPTTTKSPGTTKPVGPYYNRSAKSPKTGASMTLALFVLVMTGGVAVVSHKKAHS